MDRRKFCASLPVSGAAFLAYAEAKGIIHEEAVESVEHILLEEMELAAAQRRESQEKEELVQLPAAPGLVDILEKRMRPGIRNHLLQSAKNALERDLPEETVLACLLHDFGMAIHAPDHGYWGAQLIRPYVSEEVHWAVKYHQALRFFPDSSVGYEYPELYIRLFGEDFNPEPYIQEAYKVARKHKWYMKSRLVTMMDEYSFDRNAEVSIEPFVDIIGRHFKNPKEGLGKDNSPVFHMWHTLTDPNRPL